MNFSKKLLLKKIILFFSLVINTFALIILLTDKPFYINSDKEFIFVSIFLFFCYLILITEYLFRKTIISPLIFIFTVFNLLIGDFIISKSEIVLRKKNLPKIAKKNNIPYDTRSTFEIVNFNNRNSKEAFYPNVQPGILIDKKGNEFLPLSNISNSNIVYCNESGKRVVYKSNKYGFRSKENNIKSKKTSIKNNIFVLGDSFTQGGCVEDEFTFETLLRNKFSDFNIKSYGRGGTSLLYQYAIFKEYILPVINNNDYLFIFHYPANDFFEVRNEFNNNKFLNQYLKNEDFSQNLRSPEINEKKDSLLKDFVLKNFRKDDRKNEYLKNLKLENLMNFYFNKYKENFKNKRKEGLIIYANMINKLKSDLNDKNVNIKLICVPTFYDFGNALDKSSCHHSLNDISELIELDFIIPQKNFIELSNKNEIFPFGHKYTHFNSNGYKKFIDAISPIVKKNF